MRRKIMVVMIAAALTAATALSAFAAGSASTDGYVSASDSSSTSTTTSTTTSDSTESGTTTTTSDGVQLVSGAATSQGSTSYVNERGQLVVDNTALSFVSNSQAETAGLPDAVVDTINSINAGADLATVGTGLDLAGYSALIGTCALRTTDAVTNVEVRGNVQVPIYVPNLVQGLQNIQILFYNNFLGWQLLPPDSIDFANKQVMFTAPNSGTLTVVYQR